MRNKLAGVCFATLLIAPQVLAVSYQDLDQDADGYIDNDEAQNMPELAGQWNRTDTNQDGIIDKAEFALFEITVTQPTDEDFQN